MRRPEPARGLGRREGAVPIKEIVNYEHIAADNVHPSRHCHCNVVGSGEMIAEEVCRRFENAKDVEGKGRRRRPASL